MGFLGKLFGKKDADEKKEKIDKVTFYEQKERFVVTVEDDGVFTIGESIKDYDEEDDNNGIRKFDVLSDEDDTEDSSVSLLMEYVIDVEYIVHNEEAFDEIISDCPAKTSITDGLFTIFQEYNVIWLSDIEDPTGYEERMKERFNNAYEDWGIWCTNFKVKSVKPAEANREVFEECMKRWG